ncbi:MAG: multidrug efflux SMR transporter [Nakamurella sp.]
MSSGMAAWLWLTAAIATEVVGTSALKSASENPGIINVSTVAAGYVVSFITFAFAMRAGMQVGVAYAVWSAAGTAAIVAIGVVFYREAISAWEVFFLAVIIVGVVGLNLSGSGRAA